MKRRQFLQASVAGLALSSLAKQAGAFDRSKQSVWG